MRLVIRRIRDHLDPEWRRGRFGPLHGKPEDWTPQETRGREAAKRMDELLERWDLHRDYGN